MIKEIENTLSHLPGYNCFACGPRNEHGLRLKFFHDQATDEVFTTVYPDEHFSGWPGIVHGGVQCTLVDEVAFWAVFNKIRKIALTAKINIVYIKKVPSGRPLDVRAKIREIRERRVEVDSVIRDEDGTELASAVVTYVFPRKKVLSEILGSECLTEEFLQYVRD